MKQLKKLFIYNFRHMTYLMNHIIVLKKNDSLSRSEADHY